MRHLYSEKAYAEAYAEFGPIVRIDSLDIWVQIRDIPGTDLKDAIGLYPYSLPTKPQSSNQLRAELNDLDLVSLVLVTAPFLDDIDWLTTSFDHAREYKTHFTVEGAVEERIFKKDVRYQIRRAERLCNVQKIDLSAHIENWIEFYDVLIAKHELKDSHRFSKNYFDFLANRPEISTFGGFVDGELVSASLWIESGHWATVHLAATSSAGYKTGANYAIFGHAVSHYQDMNVILGGIPDQPKQGSDLALFKRKFSNSERKSWICGIVANPDTYEQLAHDNETSSSTSEFFPIYRSPPD